MSLETVTICKGGLRAYRTILVSIVVLRITKIHRFYEAFIADKILRSCFYIKEEMFQ